MIKENKNMTTSEWEIMRVIWTLEEATSRQIIRVMHLKTDWSPSTIKTLITRLKNKSYLIDNGAVRDRLYKPTITEHDAMTNTLHQTINSMCAMCVGDAITNAIASTPLSRYDILRLQDILSQKLSTAPETVACNCMPNNWEDEQ